MIAKIEASGIAIQEQPMRAKKAVNAEPSVVASAPLPQAISEEVLQDKYAKGDERTIDDVRRRVARALAAAELPDRRPLWEAAFLRAQVDGLIMGGRINSAAGTELKA